jgi:hypothetical protein
VIELLEVRVEAAAAAAAKNPPAGETLVVTAAFSIVRAACSAHPIVLILTGTLLTTALRQLGVSRLSRLSVPGPPLRGTPKGGGIPLSNRLSSWTRGLHRQILGGSFWGTAKFWR